MVLHKLELKFKKNQEQRYQHLLSVILRSYDNTFQTSDTLHSFCVTLTISVLHLVLCVRKLFSAR